MSSTFEIFNDFDDETIYKFLKCSQSKKRKNLMKIENYYFFSKCSTREIKSTRTCGFKFSE